MKAAKVVQRIARARRPCRAGRPGSRPRIRCEGDVARAEGVDGRRFFAGAPRLDARFSKPFDFATRRRALAHIPEAFTVAAPARVSDGALRVTFINHATVLIRLTGESPDRPDLVGVGSPSRSRAGKRVRPPGSILGSAAIDGIPFSHSTTIISICPRSSGSRRTPRRADIRESGTRHFSIAKESGASRSSIGVDPGGSPASR
jgi:hypothetical protein